MYQTQYKPLSGIRKPASAYVGGFCRVWYIPIEDIASIPPIDPVTQWLSAEPVLVSGAAWFGPLHIPDNKLGWEEDMQLAKAGIFYKQKVQGYVPGMGAGLHINLQNHAFHQFCVVGKARSGGNFYLLGNEEAGLQPDFNNSTGIGSGETPGTKMAFTGETIDKAFILPSFAGIASGGATNNDFMEIIHFTNANTIPIVYNTTRKNKFGQLPTIEVWIEGSPNFQVWPEILADTLPSPTNFTINIAGPASGYIKLIS